MNNGTIFCFESFFSQFFPTFLKSHIAAIKGMPRSAISTALPQKSWNLSHPYTGHYHLQWQIISGSCHPPNQCQK